MKTLPCRTDGIADAAAAAGQDVLAVVLTSFLTLVLPLERRTLDPSVYEAKEFDEFVEILIVQDDPAVL